jgi:hypothetical protein
MEKADRLNDAIKEVIRLSRKDIFVDTSNDPTADEQSTKDLLAFFDALGNLEYEVARKKWA